MLVVKLMLFLFLVLLVRMNQLSKKSFE